MSDHNKWVLSLKVKDVIDSFQDGYWYIARVKKIHKFTEYSTAIYIQYDGSDHCEWIRINHYNTQNIEISPLHTYTPIHAYLSGNSTKICTFSGYNKCVYCLRKFCVNCLGALFDHLSKICNDCSNEIASKISSLISSLKINDKLDVLDARPSNKCWQISTVLSIKHEDENNNNQSLTKILVHYDGWSDRWNEWIIIKHTDIISSRIRPLHTFTPYHQYLIDPTVPACTWNAKKSRSAKCDTCLRKCCMDCYILASKSERSSTYRCKSCVDTMEYQQLYEAIYSSVYNQYNIDNNIINIITDYSTGVVVSCMCTRYGCGPKCVQELYFPTKWSFNVSYVSYHKFWVCDICLHKECNIHKCGYCNKSVKAESIEDYESYMLMMDPDEYSFPESISTIVNCVTCGKNHCGNCRCCVCHGCHKGKNHVKCMNCNWEYCNRKYKCKQYQAFEREPEDICSSCKYGLCYICKQFLTDKKAYFNCPCYECDKFICIDCNKFYGLKLSENMPIIDGCIIDRDLSLYKARNRMEIGGYGFLEDYMDYDDYIITVDSKYGATNSRLNKNSNQMRIGGYGFIEDYIDYDDYNITVYSKYHKKTKSKLISKQKRKKINYKRKDKISNIKQKRRFKQNHAKHAYALSLQF